jgi:acyl carrier protein
MMVDRTVNFRILKSILEDNQGEPFDHLDEDTQLREGLGLDSVDLVTIVIEIQDRFRIQLSSEELEPVVTVADLLGLIQSKCRVVARAA